MQLKVAILTEMDGDSYVNNIIPVISNKSQSSLKWMATLTTAKYIPKRHMVSQSSLKWMAVPSIGAKVGTVNNLLSQSSLNWMATLTTIKNHNV